MKGQPNESGMAARLRRVQRKIDAEIETGKQEKNISVPCKEGCCECCSRCFCVSEAEFFLVLDHILNHWTQEEIIRIIERSKTQWEMLTVRDPACARKLEGEILLKELFTLHNTALPFPCLFLSGEGSCLIYEVRPLICRMHGIAYAGPFPDEEPCSKRPGACAAPEQYLSLAPLAEDIYSFTFLPFGEQVVIRRPMPLFYFFRLVLGDGDMLGSISEADCYRNLFELSEKEYIRSLAEPAQDE